MTMTLGEFIKWLVFLLQKEGVPLSLNNQLSWHKLFYRLKMRGDVVEKPVFLKELWFDWCYAYPKSPELSKFLQAVCWTGIVETTDFGRNYKLQEDMEQLLQRRFENLNEKTKQYLNSIVKIAKEEFAGVVSRA